MLRRALLPLLILSACTQERPADRGAQAGGAVLSAPARVAAAPLMKYIPEGASFFLVVNWGQLLADPQTAELLPELEAQLKANPQLGAQLRIAEACGADPFKDIKTVAFSGDLSQVQKTLSAVSGSLDREKALACLQEKAEGRFFGEVVDGALLFSSDEGTIANARAGKGALSAELSALLGAVDQRSLLYGAALIPEAMRGHLGPAATARALAGHLSFSARVGLELKAVVRFTSPAEAGALKAEAEALRAQFRTTLQQLAIPERALVFAVRGSDFVATLTLDPAQVGMLAKAMGADPLGE